jgi:hypothetical protein
MGASIEIVLLLCIAASAIIYAFGRSLSSWGGQDLWAIAGHCA